MCWTINVFHYGEGEDDNRDGEVKRKVRMARLGDPHVRPYIVLHMRQGFVHASPLCQV